jgi:hypothetical protein
MQLYVANEIIEAIEAIDAIKTMNHAAVADFRRN